MYKATVNSKQFDIVEGTSNNEFLVNGKAVSLDIKEVEAGYFHILYHHKGYRAEVVKADATTKTFALKINGKVVTVELKDKFDLLLEKMGMKNTAAGNLNMLKAPMPGLIIDLKVQTGDTVKVGDPLLILEAMKMENVIKSPGAGIIKNLRIKKGDRVEKNQVLIEF